MLDPQDLAELTAQPVPRYTSYPTAPHFAPSFSAEAYADRLAALPAGARLSLYAHIPFCDTLCWFCGCHTRITRQYAPLASYLDPLTREIRAIGALVPLSSRVAHLHWGGGSPTMLAPDDIRRLTEAFHEAFLFEDDAEFAIEVDPRGLDAARIAALAEGELTRVSIGVQDFDPLVQRAINREQSIEETRAVADAFRDSGVTSLNIDALYGLPHQTEQRLERTLGEVVALRPERIALFGYAHVPWMKKHMTMIPEESLPGSDERYRQAALAADFLVAAGYERIGIDHFALPHDAMAVAARKGALRRNFQGYTVDAGDALLGFGASAIGALPDAYLQNRTATARYEAALMAGDLPVERGVVLTSEDKARRAAIEMLMCRLEFSASALAAAGTPPGLVRRLQSEVADVLAWDRWGLTEPTFAGFRVSERGRPFLRVIASWFDAYFANRAARHSLAV